MAVTFVLTFYDSIRPFYMRAAVAGARKSMGISW